MEKTCLLWSLKMRFTVLTVTYNRGYLLGQTYESLCVQTFKDFEWVIIDDGSTDGTRELVSSWKSFFPIRYTWKPNGGKHTAVNMGVRQAAGEFVLIIDSDDRCVPQTLERFDYWSKQAPEPERFALFVGLCYREDGVTILGSPLPRDSIDTFSLRDALLLADADRCGVVRTDIFRRFLYPVFRGERFIPESVVWNRILRQYAARYFNEPVKIAGYAFGGLSSQAKLRWSSPMGAVLYYKELAFSSVPLTLRLKAAANAARFSPAALYRIVTGLTS